MVGPVLSCSTRFLEHWDLLDPGGPGALWEDWECLCPTRARVLSQGLVISFAVCFPLSPSMAWSILLGVWQSTYRYLQTRELPPWTLFWETPFSLCPCDVMTGSDSFFGICLCPRTRGVRMPPLFFLHSFDIAFLPYLSPLHPSCLFFFFFFVLVGPFCFYLLILFVAKQAEGGAPLCDLLLTLHLPPLLCPPPPRERERKRKRERSAGLTPAVTAAAAATTAATLVMSTCPKSNPSPGPGVSRQGHSLCGLARKC